MYCITVLKDDAVLDGKVSIKNRYDAEYHFTQYVAAYISDVYTDKNTEISDIFVTGSNARCIYFDKTTKMKHKINIRINNY